MIIHWKCWHIWYIHTLFLAPVLTNSLIFDPPEKTYCLLQPYYVGLTKHGKLPLKTRETFGGALWGSSSEESTDVCTCCLAEYNAYTVFGPNKQFWKTRNIGENCFWALRTGYSGRIHCCIYKHFPPREKPKTPIDSSNISRGLWRALRNNFSFISPVSSILVEVLKQPIVFFWRVRKKAVCQNWRQKYNESLKNCRWNPMMSSELQIWTGKCTATSKILEKRKQSARESTRNTKGSILRSPTVFLAVPSSKSSAFRK